MEVNDRQQWKDFQAKMRQSGATTVYAARAMLVKDYVEQEHERKMNSNHNMNNNFNASFAIFDSDDAIDTTTTDTNLRRANCGESSSCSIDGVADNTTNISASSRAARRGSMSSLFSPPGDEPNYESMRSHSTGQLQQRRSSMSGLERGGGSFSRAQQLKRLPSFSISQLSGGLTAEEKAKKQASTDRREGFDTMVNDMLGTSRSVPKAQRPVMERRGSFASMSFSTGLTETYSPQQRRSSIDNSFITLQQQQQQRQTSLGSMNHSPKQERRASFGVGVVEDMHQFITYSSRLVVADESDALHDESNEESINIGLSSPLTNVSANSSYSEPVEIDTDGKVKMFSSIREDEILVDFPRLPRGTSLPTISSDDDDDAPNLGCVEINFVKAIPTVSKRSSTGSCLVPASWSFFKAPIQEPHTKSSALDSQLSVEEEEPVFEKPSNWVNYDDDTSDEEG